MKQSMYCRINLLLVALGLFIQPSCWAQTGANVWTAANIVGNGQKQQGTATVVGTGPGAIYTLTGEGFFSGTVDSGEFYYHLLSGDGTLVARLLSQTGATAQSSRLGVMIRPALGNQSSNIMVGMTLLDGAFCQTRVPDGAKTVITQVPASLPLWVKVVRQGTTVAGYISQDGASWTQVGPSVTVAWPDGTYIGLGAASNGIDMVTATFDNVTLTPGPPDTPPAPPPAPTTTTTGTSTGTATP